MPRRPALPKDPNQRAKALLDMATGETVKPSSPDSKDAHEFARKGGLKGGKARALKLTPEQRVDIARAAADARWKKS